MLNLCSTTLPSSHSQSVSKYPALPLESAHLPTPANPPVLQWSATLLRSVLLDPATTSPPSCASAHTVAPVPLLLNRTVRGRHIKACDDRATMPVSIEELDATVRAFYEGRGEQVNTNRRSSPRPCEP